MGYNCYYGVVEEIFPTTFPIFKQKKTLYAVIVYHTYKAK